MDPLISLRNVSAGYENRVVLRDISIDIAEGDFTAIIGPNGSGKTTLLKIILGMIRPFSGNITNRARSQTGYLPQLSAIDRQFPITVETTVLTGLLRQKKTGKSFQAKDYKQVDETLKLLEVQHLKKKPLGELSGGQVQRVFLARALVSSPRLLILDEPDTYIDHSLKNSFFDILKNLSGTVTVVMVSHDIGTVLPMVGDIACLNETLKYHGKKENLSQNLIEETYGCPFELVDHGKIPHRIIKNH